MMTQRLVRLPRTRAAKPHTRSIAVAPQADAAANDDRIAATFATPVPSGDSAQAMSMAAALRYLAAKADQPDLLPALA